MANLTDQMKADMNIKEGDSMGVNKRGAFDRGNKGYVTGRDMGGGRGAEVKNKSASAEQITAEQILRESAMRQLDESGRAPQQRIIDEAELQDYRVRKRKEFEDNIRMQRQNIGLWVKYAQWESAQQEFRRARSIYERALQVDFQSVPVWLKYIDMEMKHKFVNHARNLFDRVCQTLPRVDQFWFKFAHMEELLGNYAGARTIYDRWMEWEPEDMAWLQYIKFEERCGEIQRARHIYERYVSCHPTVESFIRLCKFEERHMNLPRCRAAFERGIEVLQEGEINEKYFAKFAEFEERCKEIDRARAIYKLALDRLPKTESIDLYRRYISFEKQRGERDEIENVVLNKRRHTYEEQVKENPRNYDAWFDYIRLEENCAEVGRTRELFERAVSARPLVLEKRFWRRYIYIWINYALFEELETGDVERTRKVYDAMMSSVPHKSFSFAKVWSLYAEFEVRQGDIEKARKIFGRAIAECGKVKIFLAYADLELRLGNIDRCRKIYEKFIEVHPLSPKPWIAYIDLEDSVEETERARAIADLAISQEQVDMPETIWKRYIDLEESYEEFDRVRKLYERLLNKTQHVRVFSSYVQFEITVKDFPRARKVLERGVETMKNEDKKEERAALLEQWLKMETSFGSPAEIQAVGDRQPKKIKKKRAVVADDGTEEGWEEYTDYIFPDDAPAKQNLKILEMAKMWKKRKAEELA